MTNLCFVTLRQSRSQSPRCFVNLNGQRGSLSLTKRIAASGNEIDAEVEKVHGSDSASFSANKENIISAIFQRATDSVLSP